MIAMLKLLTVTEYFVDRFMIHWIWTVIFAGIRELATKISSEQLVVAMRDNKNVIEEVLG